MRVQVHLPFLNEADDADFGHTFGPKKHRAEKNRAEKNGRVGSAFRTAVGLAAISLAVNACDPQTRRAAVIGGGAGALGGLTIGAVSGIGILTGTIVGAGVGAGAGAIYANRDRLGQTLSSKNDNGNTSATSDGNTASGLTEASRTAARRSAFANTAPQGTAPLNTASAAPQPIPQRATAAVAQAPAPQTFQQAAPPLPPQTYIQPTQAGTFAPAPSYVPPGQQSSAPNYAAGGLYAPQPGYIPPGAPLQIAPEYAQQGYPQQGYVQQGYAPPQGYNPVPAPTPQYTQQAYLPPTPLYNQPTYPQTAPQTAFNAPVTTTDLGGGFSESVSRVQAGLARLGYDSGPANRIQPDLLEGAVRKYQRDNSLPVTGRIDDTLVRRIDEQSGRSSY